MESLESLRNAMPDYSRDIKINLENLVSEKNEILSTKQVFGSALASAYASKQKTLIKVLEEEAKKYLSDSEINGVRIATTIMAMNNIYYRFAHISHDKEYLQLPAGLRMRGIADHGIDKIDFEIYSLAVSIVNGCSGCIDAHANQIIKHEYTKQQVQAVAKIAAVIHAVAQTLIIQE